MLPRLSGQTCLVVDLSHYFPHADFAAAAAAGVSAVMLKATQGAGFHDPAFTTLLGRARRAGLLTGAYHFGTAADATAQAEHFLAAAGAAACAGGEILAALDIETNTLAPADTMSPAQAEEWVRIFRQRTGRAPLIYAGAYLREHGGAARHAGLAGCPLWLAEYGSQAVALPGWPDWTLWQFSDGHAGPYAGPVAGIGRCDQSVFRGTAADLAALWAAPPAAAPAAPAAAPAAVTELPQTLPETIM
jgi:lysozyme